jgi:hypothetical protein
MATTKKAPSVDVTAEVGKAQAALAPAVKRLTKALAALNPEALPIGAASDLLYDLRGLSSQLNAVTAPFEDVTKPAVKLLEDFFIDSLAVGESSGVQGMHSRSQVTDSAVPVVNDWTAFYKHIAKTKSWELLNKAVNRAAVTERWDLKKQVPGVGVFHAKRVSCTKLNGKKGGK